MTEHLVDDLLQLRQGFLHHGEAWHLVCIGCKGDMPFLVKTGGFERHWLRAERKANARSRTRASPGVCRLVWRGPQTSGLRMATWIPYGPTPRTDLRGKFNLQYFGYSIRNQPHGKCSSRIYSTITMVVWACTLQLWNAWSLSPGLLMTK